MRNNTTISVRENRHTKLRPHKTEANQIAYKRHQTQGQMHAISRVGIVKTQGNVNQAQIQSKRWSTSVRPASPTPPVKPKSETKTRHPERRIEKATEKGNECTRQTDCRNRNEPKPTGNQQNPTQSRPRVPRKKEEGIWAGGDGSRERLKVKNKFYIHTHIHIHTCTYIQIYTYTHTYIHRYAYT